MVVVDEIDEAVVDPLVVGDVRVGPVDAHGLAQHLGERPAAAHQIIVGRAGADLVAREDAILELCVERTRRCALGIGGCSKRHGNDPLLGKPPTMMSHWGKEWDSLEAYLPLPM